MAKVLIQDIARALNMSRNTVAKALKNDASVTENTRIVIAQTALTMGYERLEPALHDLLRGRRLDYASSNKRYAILARNHTDDDFWRSIIWGITERIQQEKASCILTLITDDEVEHNLLPVTMVNEKIDGVICLELFPDPYYEMLQRQGYTFVAFDRSPQQRRRNFDVVYQAGEQSVYEITCDLIRRGCRRMGFIGDINYCQSLLERYNGFMRAMQEAELSVLPQHCLTKGTFYFYEKASLEKYIDAMGELPEAIVCANDQIALNVIQILKQRGVEVPKRVAVTGFDDKQECLIVEPHLTSVSSGGNRIGLRLVQQLLWRLENPTLHFETILIETKPVFRESSDM